MSSRIIGRASRETVDIGCNGTCYQPWPPGNIRPQPFDEAGWIDLLDSGEVQARHRLVLADAARLSHDQLVLCYDGRDVWTRRQMQFCSQDSPFGHVHAPRDAACMKAALACGELD